MLEVKAKDQGHNARVLSKKKKIFAQKTSKFSVKFQALSNKKRFSRRKSQTLRKILDKEKKIMILAYF